MTVEKYNDFLEIDVTASEEKSEENVFVDHSLKIKSFLDGKVEEVKGLSGKNLIKVFKNAGSLRGSGWVKNVNITISFLFFLEVFLRHFVLGRQ